MTEVSNSTDALQRCISALESLVVEELDPGQALPSENDLAERTGLSRVTIREGLKVLSGRGLVELRRGTRAVVREPDPKIISSYFAVLVRRDPRALLDLVELREALEVQAAAGAARNATGASIRLLQATFADLEAAIPKDRETEVRFHHLDVAFHEALAVASGNRMLAFMLEGLAQVLEYSFSRSAAGAASRGSTYQDCLNSHRRILECVQSGNSSGAASAMRQHLRLAAANLRQALRLAATAAPRRASAAPAAARQR